MITRVYHFVIVYYSCISLPYIVRSHDLIGCSVLILCIDTLSCFNFDWSVLCPKQTFTLNFPVCCFSVRAPPKATPFDTLAFVHLQSITVSWFSLVYSQIKTIRGLCQTAESTLIRRHRKWWTPHLQILSKITTCP